ncbi:putative phospholipase D [Seiridium unicorne]|uniref:phospholipase D n=1 Tax=Seiridium unicorne TaxID=138068 RepID=A0ABR2UUD9_9PEZI
MAWPPRSDSISPMTRALKNTDPVPSRADRPTVLRASSGPAAPIQTPSTELLSANGIAVESPRGGVQEATDYMNGGLPHVDPSPVSGTATGSPDSAALESQASPRKGVFARGSGNSDVVTPAEPMSPGRRSVQFARADMVLDPPSINTHTRQDSWDGDVSGRSRSERFVSKLKSLAVAGPSQTPRPAGPSETPLTSRNTSPVMSRTHRIPTTTHEEGSDADVDESEDEEFPRTQGKQSRRKRMKRRLKTLDIRSPQSTPKIDGEDLDSPSEGRFRTMIRRSTMPDATEQRGGLSEGEGRDHLDRMRRGSSWLGRSRSELDQEGESSQMRMPGHRRRISDILGGGGVSDGDGLATPRRPLFASDRATTFGAQTWKQITKTFKALGGGRKPADTFDFHKSAELMAELRAVTPAVVILASMLQRDEHGYKRIPVLLEQLKIKIIDSQPDKGEKEKGHSERHSVFTFQLEYGSGPSQMSWVIERSVYELAELHTRYRLSLGDKNPLQTSSNPKHKPKQPHFPRSTFPYLRSVRGLGLVDSDEEEKAPENRVDLNRIDEAIAEGTAGEMTAAEGTASEMDRPGTARRKRSRINLLGIRRQSSGFGDLPEGSNLNPRKAELQRRKFVERQRSKLEKYLQEMIHWLMFRADANRLCRFLELSALGVRLAADGSYHGKECFLHIQSSKGVDFRRALTPAKIAARHSRKWFLVRESYIVVAESPSTMEVYDVYLVDPSFRVVSKANKLKQLGAKAMGDSDASRGKGKGKEAANDEPVAGEVKSSGKHHTLKIYTSERKIKLYSRKERIMQQFDLSVQKMLKQTKWAEPHRFDSFAPVRDNVFAQWLVDGRDYMWMVSRAISMAQDVIYIHDWWLSPELYMRRPAVISEKWRLDRLLRRKAQEGVKVFVIVYRNVEQAIPIDSEHTKFALHSLHPNILVQRSPNQFKKNQFFYAHHEKICIVDHDVAFMGGIDLCFGRWDTPQHSLTDDRPTGYEQDGETPKDADHCQLWPGKDYSNPRVLDFFRLNQPYEEMYDRSKVPRMPWHDVAMQVVGQPARDLTRHFVQRWNYLRRERNPTRPMPFLLPPPDAKHEDLKHLGLTGTCEVQILRSAGDWSLGLPRDVTEHSILTAYISLIKQSEHFVYMENQFFITSCETLGTRVVNGIGDALVERIIRAHENDEDWRCCIMIPLMPGFQNTVRQDSGSSVRLIMQFQYRSICRGSQSIFGRLRARNIDPEDYISFFSLRKWGVMENGHIVTEQLYIHAKTIIVDDRAVLIGSANINERSMLGNRDSEVAALVRDTKDEWITMAGVPYRVGAFAHTLRMRLMREHLGLDVDKITEQERAESLGTDAEYEAEMSQIYQESDSSALNTSTPGLRPVPSRHSYINETGTPDPEITSSSNSSKGKSPQRRARGLSNQRHTGDASGNRALGNSGASSKEALDSVLKKSSERLPPPPDMIRRTTAELGLTRLTQLPTLPVTDDTDIGGPPLLHDANGNPTYEQSNPLAADITPAVFDKDIMRDPLNPAFWDDVWSRVAENNTKLYRRVFRCMPDSEAPTWKEYNEFEAYAERFSEMMTGQKKSDEEHDAKSQFSQSGGGAGVGIAAPPAAHDALHAPEKAAEKLMPDTNPEIKVSNGDAELNEKTPLPDPEKSERLAKPNLSLSTDNEKAHSQNAEAPSPVTPFPAFEPQTEGHLEPQTATNNLQTHKTRDRRTTFSSIEKPTSSQGGGSTIYAAPNGSGTQGSVRRRRRATTKGSRRGPVFPYDVVSREMAEELCNLIQGHVVQFPYDWLEVEEEGNHWLFQPDMLAPKEIYD